MAASPIFAPAMKKSQFFDLSLGQFSILCLTAFFILNYLYERIDRQ